MTVSVRQARENDHVRIVESVQNWWSDSRSPDAARELSLLVPRLFLQHFAGTSFVAEQDGQFAGFLVGFFSFDHPDDAYIHFVGVDPALRGGGLARKLYETFFGRADKAGRSRVHAITSPANVGSIGFHRSMGFELVPGDGEQDGVAVHHDYDGRGHASVRFLRKL